VVTSGVGGRVSAPGPAGGAYSAERPQRDPGQSGAGLKGQ